MRGVLLVALGLGGAGSETRTLVGCAARGHEPARATPVERSPGASLDRSAQCAPGRAVVWRGGFSEPDWLHAWDAEATLDYGADNAQIVNDESFGRVLRVRYPAGSSSDSYAKEGHPVGGLEFKANLPESLESVSLSYWLRFDPGFPWILGGKLPGLCGGTCPSGGAHVSGTGGWSMRSMWRPRGAGELYGYVLPAQAYGTELGLGAWSFTTGEWHHVVEELVLNTSGEPNGVVRVWYDTDPSRSPTFETANLTYRTDATPISRIFFSTFFGGHDASWATPTDTSIEFAEFVVCR
jgi:hypothetical protein